MLLFSLITVNFILNILFFILTDRSYLKWKMKREYKLKGPEQFWLFHLRFLFLCWCPCFSHLVWSGRGPVGKRWCALPCTNHYSNIQIKMWWHVSVLCQFHPHKVLMKQMSFWLLNSWEVITKDVFVFLWGILTLIVAYLLMNIVIII